MKNDNSVLMPEIRFEGFTDVWIQRKLGEVTEFYSGLTYSPENLIDSGGTLVLRSSNVQGGEIVDADNVYVDSDVVNCSNVEVGDIIVVVRNGSRNLIGKHAQVKTKMDHTVIGAFMTGLRSTQTLFIHSLLNTQQFDMEIAKNLGATINQITIGAFKQMLFSMPSETTEQTAIGNFFRTLDDTITLCRRRWDELKKLKSAYLQQMFPQERGRAARVRFSGFTGDWEEQKVGEFIEGYVKKTTKQNQYPVLTSSQQQGIVFQEDYFAKRQVTTEDNIGYCVLPRGYFTYRSRSDNGVFKFNRNDLVDKGIISYFYPVFKIVNGDSNFFLQLLNSSLDKQVALEAEGTGQRVLSLKKFKSIIIHAPSIKEQISIGKFFHNLDKQIALQQTKLEQMQQLKSAYLQKMFI